MEWEAVAARLQLAPCFLHRLPAELEPRMQPLDPSSLWRSQHSAEQTHNLATRCEGSQGKQDGSEGGGVCDAG